MNFKQQIARYVAGYLTTKQLPDIGVIGLGEGLDSPSLRVLAGLDNNENPFVIEHYFELALAELNIQLPEKKQAILECVPEISDEIKYKETKLIKQGKTAIKREFKPLAEWIDKEFSVKTLNIIYYNFLHSVKFALDICLEFEHDKNKFYNEALFFDKEKQQAIGRQFKVILQVHKDGYSKYETDDIWVVFSAFEAMAKVEANESIPKEKIQEFIQNLGNNELWQIRRFYETTTFFVYTDKQVEEYNKNGVKEEWTEKYFRLLQQYDEFHYFKRELFSIQIDSKENFDKRYQSNWYYYYK